MAGVAAMTSITAVASAEAARLTSGISEVDRVLGGGFVPGSIALFGGDPGIGKSTLLLQVAGRMARAGAPVLYITGEESAAQIRGRGERIGSVVESSRGREQPREQRWHRETTPSPVEAKGSCCSHGGIDR